LELEKLESQSIALKTRIAA